MELPDSSNLTWQETVTPDVWKVSNPEPESRPRPTQLRWSHPAHLCLRWSRPAHLCLRWSRPAHLCLRWSRPAHLRPRWHCPVQRFQSAPETQHYPSAHESQRFPSAPEILCFPSTPEILRFSSAPRRRSTQKDLGGGGHIPVVLLAIVAMHGTLVRATMAPLSRPYQKIITPWPPEAPDPPWPPESPYPPWPPEAPVQPWSPEPQIHPGGFPSVPVLHQPPGQPNLPPSLPGVNAMARDAPSGRGR